MDAHSICCSHRTSNRAGSEGDKILQQGRSGGVSWTESESRSSVLKVYPGRIEAHSWLRPLLHRGQTLLCLRLACKGVQHVQVHRVGSSRDLTDPFSKRHSFWHQGREVRTDATLKL
eukprot:3507303-Amphidinium_carterae.1